MTTPALADRPGPLLQSVTIGFRAIYLATALLALVWLASGIRQVPPDSRAVVTSFGRIVRVQSAGLLIALPPPIQTVRIIPGAEQLLRHTVSPVPRAAGLDDVVDIANGEPMQGSAGSYLTGDGGVVLLDAVLTCRITDPVAYVIAEAHIAPALDRLFRTAAIAVAARHKLDDFLVTHPDLVAAGGSAAQLQAVRDELATTLNDRLRTLAAAQAGLGVEVERIDITAYLPIAAKRAFDAVLSADQRADQALARARTDAERRRQEAERERDRLLTVARANAAEQVSRADAATARITALAAQATGDARDSLLDRLYRDRIAQLLHQIGHVTTVDPRGGARVILPASGVGPGGTP
jgi:regulator of protease activity HflC (stomatin/prohibitin superfamily)